MIDASIPLAAVSNPPDVIGSFMRAAQFQHMIQTNQAGQLQIQAYQQQQADDQALREAMRNAYDAQGNFSFDRLRQNAMRAGINPATWQAIERGHSEIVDKLATANKTQ